MKYIPAIIAAMVLILIAFFLNRGKGGWLIAGFNMLTEEERKAYDMKAAGKFISKVLTGMAMCLVVFDGGWYIDSSFIIALSWTVFGVIAVFAIVYSCGDRFKRK